MPDRPTRGCSLGMTTFSSWQRGLVRRLVAIRAAWSNHRLFGSLGPLVARYLRRFLRWPAPSVLFAWPLFTLLHQLMTLAMAQALAWLARAPVVQAIVLAGPWDDVHSRLALEMIAGTSGQRLVLRGFFDAPLAHAFPYLVAPSALFTKEAWTGLLLLPGSSAVAVHLAEMVINLSMMCWGASAILALRLWRRGDVLRPEYLLFFTAAWGLLVYGAVAQLNVAWHTNAGSETVLSILATKLLGMERPVYDGLLRAGPLLSLAVNGCLVTVSLAVAACSFLLWRKQRAWPHARARLLVGVRKAGSAAPALLLLGALLSQTLFTRGVAFEPTISSVPPQRLAELLAPPPGSPASVVTITEKGRGFEYRVNGRRRSIRGFGYNAITIHLPPEERQALLDRDFATIRKYGANVILGWDPEEFDRVLMATAAAHGLGVILPFDLQPMWAYEDPQVRQQLLQEIREWVARYKTSPALRMWGLGNEVVHGIANPRSVRSNAFANFLIEAADAIHRQDPYHPVVYRDAEDVYLEPVALALARDGVQRPWFVYGMNFFTMRVQEALLQGPAASLRQPLLISEFGPVGLNRGQRASAYGRLWRVIRGFPEGVLGGSAYVWSTAGPEPLDRSFGLTNANGEPVDDALFTLAALYLKERNEQLQE